MQKPAQFRISARELLPLSEKQNVAGLVRVTGHFSAILLTGYALWQNWGSWFTIPLTFLQGYFVAFLFTTEHEMAHHTAFKSRALNYTVGHIAGVAIILPYEYYRAFHWDHHRFTNDPAKDPELAIPLPMSKLGLLWFFSGIPTWIDRGRLLVKHACGRVDKPWIPEAKRGLIAKEARLYLLFYACVAITSFATQSLLMLIVWGIPVVVGQLILRLYLLTEHTGCPHNANMLENTRTTYTNRWIRFFAWNMPYHVEHHAYPSVPFHALPKLNHLLATHIANTEKGYPASTSSAMRHVLSQIKK